jgi:Lrp/AsnC family transcriptional regulator, leucine-responsive regulatory protein
LAPYVIDETDRAIITELEIDARQTLAEIADKVNLSGPAVKRRIDRLTEAGVINGFTIRVDQRQLGRTLEAFIELKFAGSTSVDEITRLASQIPEVDSVFTTAGDPDALLRLRVEDVDHLKLAINRIRKSGRVTGTKTLMVLGSWSRGGSSSRA